VNKTMEKSKEKSPCPMTMCEDPVTGRVFAVRGKDCPPGTFEQVAHIAMKHGVEFRFDDEKGGQETDKDVEIRALRAKIRELEPKGSCKTGKCGSKK